jgi:dipeptidyl aminopeptidase/acylaminoacyl peptidase
MRIVAAVVFCGLALLPLSAPGRQPMPLRAARLQTADNLVLADKLDDNVFVGWLDDEHWLEARGGVLRKVEAVSGRHEPVTGLSQLTPGQAGVGRTELIERALSIANLQKADDPDVGQFDLFTRRFDAAGPFLQGKKKTDNMGSKASPDGKWKTAVKNNDLYLVDRATNAERRITFDGSDVVYNGVPDWVYLEEVYDRDPQGPWWSPDSTHVAFLRLDDTSVSKFILLDHTQRQQKPEITTFPNAGEPNPTVKLGIVRVGDGDGKVTWVELGDYPSTDLLITRVGWLPSSKQAYFFVQNRTQTWLDLCNANRETGKATRLFRDQTKAWIDPTKLGPLQFLKDGSFLFMSERTGYMHLYLYAADGQLKNAVTSGDWAVRAFNKLDEADGWVYFSGTRDGWLGNQSFRVKLDGTGIERLTKDDGTHLVQFSPGAKYFVDSWSTIATPPEARLVRANGETVRPIRLGGPSAQAVQPAKAEQAKLVEIVTPDGFPLAATVLLPPDHDPMKKYPVWLMTYGGPQMPMVRNAFTGSTGNDLRLAKMGFIVFHVDPRSASDRGAVSAWIAYKQLGVQELKDYETAVRWLLDTYPSADAKRIGMSGHSYGGYITAYALTHSTVFAAGIAGAPVTDWRNYDTIYTERYMSTPQENPEGYKVSSVVEAAKNLHGKLLLLHGMIDDNVHMQNSVQLMDALQKADRDFEVMFYPHSRHGIGGAHYARIQTDFMKRVLQP